MRLFCGFFKILTALMKILSPKTRNFVVIVVRNTSLNLKKKQKREDEKLVKDVFSEEERQEQGDRLQRARNALAKRIEEGQK